METERLNISLLLDCYGGLLTGKQRCYLELYYNEDLSFAEISEITGVSRPGVFNMIDRSRKKLSEFERKTGIAARIEALRAELAAAGRGNTPYLLNEVSNGV
ncbi:MAG: DNA-binding protein [Oscillospiraceae bacterium]|jgi:predicted DNA-binding protein YlxM (UPF0122 family)|nr:DNA-binding protein [Oscillospiraceae bacterium]